MNFAPGFDQIHHDDGVALLARAAVGDVENGEALVFGRLERVEPLRVLGVLVDELVLRLRRADAMVKDLVVLVDRRELLALLRLRVAAVVEAVAAPRDTRHLDPLDLVGERLARRQDRARCIPASPNRCARCRRRRAWRPSMARTPLSTTVPSSDQRVGIDEHLGLALDALLDVEHALVLQTVVLARRRSSRPCVTAPSISRSCTASRGARQLRAVRDLVRDTRTSLCSAPRPTLRCPVTCRPRASGRDPPPSCRDRCRHDRRCGSADTAGSIARSAQPIDITWSTLDVAMYSWRVPMPV